jgi:hypothetical protein
MRHRFLWLLPILAIAQPLLAQTINWIGPTSGNYNNPGNWAGSLVPNGGTLTAHISPANATTVTLNTSPILRNLTLGAGHRLLATDQSLQFDGASSLINNAGTMSFTSVGSFSSLFWLSNNNVTLTGGGTVIFAGGDLGGPTGTFTNQNNTIRGYGFLGGSNVPFLNNGTISCEPNGSFDFVLDWPTGPNGFVNNGTLQAGTGTWFVAPFTGQLITNNGTIQAQNGATFTGGQGFLFNGNLRTLGNGVIQNNSTATAQNITNHGLFRAAGTGTLTLAGNNTNHGTLQVFGRTLVSGSVNLAGSGTIHLGLDDGNANNGIFFNGAGTLITSNNIVGGGTLGSGSTALRTSGRIIPTRREGSLALHPSAGGMVHTGTITVGPGAQINLQSGSFDFSSASITLQPRDSDPEGTIFTTAANYQAGQVTLDGLWWTTNNSNGTFTSLRSAFPTTTPPGLLRINQSRVTLRAGGGTVGTSRTGGLSMETGAVFDLTDHAFIIDLPTTGTLTFFSNNVRTAYNNGSWNGTGITSSLATAASTTTTKTAVGYAHADTILGSFPATFHGQPVVNPKAIVLLYTLSGDANLDRTVNIADFARIGARFNGPGVWFDGDFNYDNQVNIADFALLAANFNKTLPVASPLPRGGAVPEPGGFAAVVLAASLARRRR